MKEQPPSESELDMLRVRLYQEYAKNNPQPSSNASSTQISEWERNRSQYVEDRMQQCQYGVSDKKIPPGHVFAKHK